MSSRPVPAVFSALRRALVGSDFPPTRTGLDAAPTGTGWLVARIAWLPLFAAVTAQVARGWPARDTGRHGRRRPPSSTAGTARDRRTVRR